MPPPPPNVKSENVSESSKLFIIQSWKYRTQSWTVSMNIPVHQQYGYCRETEETNTSAHTHTHTHMYKAAKPSTSHLILYQVYKLIYRFLLLDISKHPANSVGIGVKHRIKTSNTTSKTSIKKIKKSLASQPNPSWKHSHIIKTQPWSVINTNTSSTFWKS